MLAKFSLGSFLPLYFVICLSAWGIWLTCYAPISRDGGILSELVGLSGKGWGELLKNNNFREHVLGALNVPVTGLSAFSCYTEFLQ